MATDPGPYRKKKRRRRRRRRRSRWYIWVIVLLALLGAAAAFFLSTYVFVGGQVYRRDAESLDLRNERISPEEYNSLREKMPDCDILWSVPIGDGVYDCTAEHVDIASFRDGDEANFAFFRGLQSVDATAAPLTAAQYEAIRSALPGAAIRWCVPIGEGRYPSDSYSVKVGDFTQAELGMFDYFDTLQEVDARSAQSYDAILALKENRPGLSVLWRVPFSGSDYPQDAEEIAVTDPSLSAADLDEALSRLPGVKTVSVPECPWTEAEKAALAEKYPRVDFRWTVSVLGEKFTSEQEELSFAGRSLTDADLAELQEKLPYFPELRSIDFTGCGLSPEQLLPLQEAYPDLELLFSFDLLGVKVNTADTLIDLSNIPMDSAEPLEKILPFMHHLEKVDMCDCGLSDEEMDALNKRHEQTQFVWMLHIDYYKIRTDTTAFRASSNHYSSFDANSIRRLAYCENMIAMDLGHRLYFNGVNLEFLRGMPHVKYLILMQCYAMDLTPLADCKELIWLELNLSLATDITPLKGCDSLHDLNITFMPLDGQSACDTIAAMPQLERVWCSKGQFTDEQLKTMQDANPELLLHVVMGPTTSSSEDPWRFDQDYYDMRDEMNMFYMDGVGYIDYKIIDGVRYELDPEFLAQQGDTSHDKDRG